MPKPDYDKVARDALITATARSCVQYAQREGQRVLLFEDDLMPAAQAFELGYRTACAKIAELITTELAK